MAIEKRNTKDGKPAYRVRIAAIDPKTSKRQNKTIGTYRTRKAAEKAERDALTEQERGTLVDPKKLSVADLLDSWLATKAGSITSNSHKDYEITIRRHLKPAFGTTKAQRLTSSQVQAQYDAWRDEYLAYQAELKTWAAALEQSESAPGSNRAAKPLKPDSSKGVSPRMIHRCHIVLSQALVQGVKFGLLTRNVCLDVTKPSLSRSKPTIWTTEETAHFLDQAKTDPLAPLWYFLALEAMRRGEALGLRWSDVNWDRGTVHIVQTVIMDRNTGAATIQERTKTRAGTRSVRLTDETLAILEAHKDRQKFIRQSAGDAWQDHDLITCTSLGTPVNPNNVTRSYNRLVMLSGVPRIRVHDMRHGAASILLRAGISAKVVQERLGHASISVTLDIYSHIVGDMQDIAATAMSAALKKAREVG